MGPPEGGADRRRCLRRGGAGGSVMLPRGEFDMRLRLEEGQNYRGGPEGGHWWEECSGRRTHLVTGQKGEE